MEGADGKARRTVAAVASWLCGTIEGIARDSADMSLAEALDSWLRYQKRSDQTLYSGNAICVRCGHPWEYFVLSTDSGCVHCPRCGAMQKSSLKPLNDSHAIPENKEALEKVRKEAEEIVSRIDILNRSIKENFEAKHRKP